MSTWNNITIERPGALTKDTLPDALTRDGELWEGYDVWDERAIAEGGGLTISGWSKYEASEAGAALLELSRTTGTITWREEHEYDETSKTVTVYRDGAHIHEESKHDELVPDNLQELVGNVRSARIGHNAMDGTCDEFDEAVLALLDALDPKRVRV